MTLVSKLGASAFLLMSMFVGAAFPTATRADIIMDWNVKADEIAAQKQVLPFNHARAVAMLQVAMFEAVNSIERRYAPYKLNLLADGNLSKEAAAASAGYDVLLALYPDRKAELGAMLATMLAGVSESEIKTEEHRFGQKSRSRTYRVTCERWTRG